MINFDWIDTILGAIMTLILALIREHLKTPTLKYEKISGPWYIDKIPLAQIPDRLAGAHAYRLRIMNKKKRLPFNVAAENCVCWVNIDDVEETFQMPWIGGGKSFDKSIGDSVDINVEDYRELDFCARSIKSGQIVAPSIEGYSLPITLGDGTQTITGHFRVTSKNG
ncbi:hypothetical protein KAU18_07715, partial [Candidatus Bathyarchaeota archaeon]|nr:hypothetical protein [Candidatus Bathyarchaeota archaeon]